MASFLRAPEAASKWATLVAVCLGLGMLMIDTFVVNVAFPAIGRDLDANLATAEWTVSGYVLVLGVFPLAMGRLGDILGRRQVYLWGLVLFVIASAGCGFAANIEQLIALRVLQGLGAAVMMPGTLSIVTNAFPPQQRGLAIGLWGGVSGIGLIAGPILGGLLVHGDSWRWIFLLNVPIGVVAMAMGLRRIPESRDPNAPRSIDFAGAGLLAGGLALVMFAFSEANGRGWGDPVIVGCLASGAMLLVLFVVAELRVAHPLVDVRLFRNPQFAMACLSAFLFSAAVFGTQPFTSLFMQNTLGFSPLQGGFGFLPATFLVAALMPFSGVLAQKLGTRIRLLLIAGSASVAISFIYLLTLTPEDTYVSGLLPPFILRGLGIGLFMSTSSVAVMSSLPMTRAGLASGTLTMFRQTGTAVGVALFGSIFVHHIDADLPARLEGHDEAQVARVTAAAEHFALAGDGEVREQAHASVVDGFVLMSEVGVAVASIAAASAFFLRRQEPVALPTAVPVAAGAGGSG
ncbi:MAG: MFS transporter [Dehalococcoidia bacterium]|nr:MFS transporter [Dehalococcoidia bacterium]